MLAVVAIASAEPVGAADLQGLKKMSLEELSELEVTSVSRAPEKLSDTSSAIQVVTSADIDRSGATTLPEALALAGNLNVAQKNSHDWGISARGFNTELANKLLVMVDGRTIYTPLFSGVRWDVQDYLLADLDRIEVISGPGGSVWGANAVNGVINITSKSSRYTQGLYAEALGGSIGQAYGVRYGGTVTPRTTYRVYAKYSDRTSETLASGADAGDDWQHRQAGFRVDSGDGDTPTLTIQGDIYDGTEGFVGGGTSVVGGGNLLGRVSRELSGGSQMQLQVYFDRTYFRQPVLASAFAPAGTFGDGLNTFDVDFQDQMALGSRQRLVWGAGYRGTDDRSDAAPGLAFAPTRLRQDLFSGFAQDEISLTRAVTATLGTKVEHTSYTGFEVEPTVRLQWKVAADNLIWGAVSRAVRTPSRIDHDLREPAQGPTILAGGSDFTSEELIAYELGYRTQMGPRFFASIAGFYNQYDRIRSVRLSPVTVFPFVFDNDLEGDTYGFELTANYQALDWWRVSVAYDLLKEHLRPRPGTTDLNNALNETSDPAHQAMLRSTMDLPHGIQFDGTLRWVDSLAVNNNGQVATVPSYAELGLRIGWHVNDNWEVSVVGQNLLDRRHPEFGLPGPLRVEIGRQVYGKIVWRF